MNQKTHSGYRPPKTDYAQKEELLRDIIKMKNKMSLHQDAYEEKLDILESLEILEKRRSSILAVFIICVMFRVALEDTDSIICSETILQLGRWNSLKFTIFVVIIIPLVYLILHKFLVFLKTRSYNKKLGECESYLLEAYNSYGVCPISYKYAMPDIVSSIEDLILDGRADTVKEAINLIIADEQSAKLLEYQEQIARSSKQTAVATTVTAFFSWRNAKWAKRNYNEISKKK